jgi:hypothetical protein
MSRYKAPKVTFLTDAVFAAACAAQRINGEYIKEDKNLYDVDGYIIGTEKVSNKKLARRLLDDEQQITADDRDQALRVRSYCNSLTFKVLQGQRLSVFEQVMLRIAEKEVIEPGYDLAVISSLPSSYERSIVRRDQDRRVRETDGFIGKVGDRVELAVEVVKCYYTRNYNVFFVTAITDDNKSVFFSCREQIELGSRLCVKGTVKAHRDRGSTQLSRVKVKD